MAIRDEVLKELLEGYKKPEDLLGPEGLLKQLTAALVSKALSAEMTEHLGYEKHEPAGRGSGNSRNGTSDKTLKTESGARLEPHEDATMLLTAVSEAVERYDPSREAAILLETYSGFEVLILSPTGGVTSAE